MKKGTGSEMSLCLVQMGHDIGLQTVQEIDDRIHRIRDWYTHPVCIPGAFDLSAVGAVCKGVLYTFPDRSHIVFLHAGIREDVDVHALHHPVRIQAFGQVAHIEDILVSCGEGTKAQQRAELFREDLLLGIDQQAGSFVIHAHIEAVFVLLNLHLLVDTQVDLI